MTYDKTSYQIKKTKPKFVVLDSIQTTTSPEIQSPPVATVQSEAVPQEAQPTPMAQPVQEAQLAPQSVTPTTPEVAWPDAQQAASQPPEIAPNQAEAVSGKTGSKVGLILGLLVALGVAIVVLVLL